MREMFFIAVGVMVGGAVVGLGLWKVVLALYSLWTDRRLGRELDELREDANRRRQQQSDKNDARLDNGCDHDFGGGFGAFFNGPAGRLEGRYTHSETPNAPLAIVLHPNPEHRWHGRFRD